MPRFDMLIRATFSNSINLTVINEFDKGAMMQISIVLWRTYHVACQSVLSWDFLDIYLTTFSESLITKIQNLWGRYFLSKYLEFSLNFKNAAKNWGKVFGFWDNCIWIGIVISSLLRTTYISSTANVLTSSSKILHVNKRDIFQLNWLGSDHWKW